jgi:hypothetical protein
MNDAKKGKASPDPRGETTALDPEAGAITIINTYVVDPKRTDELIAFLVEASRSTLRHVPGFISANLHVALDGKQVVNHGPWKSHEAPAAVRENSQVVALMQEQSRIAKSFAPILYTLRACTPAAS